MSVKSRGPFNPVAALSVVADSWEHLRRCDVNRLIEPWDGWRLEILLGEIRRYRPDLLTEARDCAKEQGKSIPEDDRP